MNKKTNDSFLKRSLSLSAVTLLLFIGTGITEIYNNIFFKTLVSGRFPNKFFIHFFPILFMYIWKSLLYLGILLFILSVTTFIFKYFKSPVKDCIQSPPAINFNFLMFFHDLLPPLFLIILLFIDYRSGPITLSYYYYYLSDTLSPILKSALGFNGLNFFINLFLSVILIIVFFRYRISKYSGCYISLFLVIFGLAVLPNILFLVQYFSGVFYKAVFSFAGLVVLVSVGFLLRYLFMQNIHRGFKTGLVAVIFLLLAGNFYAFKAGKDNRFNVVHIILDTLRKKSFNERTMPFLYSLKDKGIYFPNSISSSDNTVTSHNAIYYGLYASLVGLEHGPFPETTVMELLSRHGYRTEVVSANGRFCIVNGFDKGVEDFYEVWKSNNHVRNMDILSNLGLSEKFSIFEKQFATYNKNYVNKVSYFDKKPLGQREYRYFNYEPAEIVNVFVKNVIEKNSPSIPFYLFINYLDPHAPYLAPTPEKISRVVEKARVEIPEIYNKLGFDHFAVEDTTIFTQITLMWNEVDSLKDKAVRDRFLTYCYEENLNYLDQQMQQLFAYFEEKNLLRNTLFIVTSDHGESMGEHNLYKHGNKRLYNPEIQVPLFFILPEKLNPLVENRIVNQNTQSVDFFPTIIDFVGIQTDIKFSGKSLLPYIFTTSDSDHVGYAITEYTGVRAITDNNQKLIVRDNETELYDLLHDPEERNNLSSVYPEVVTALLKVLEEQTRATYPVVKNQKSELSEEKRYDTETVRLLKTLGYIK